MGDEKKLIKLSKALSDKVTHRISQHYLKTKNEPQYHNMIHREVKGSKTAVSRALHILSDEHEIFEKYYEVIPVKNPNPHDRQISVLMFKIKDDYFKLLQKYEKDLF